MLGVSFKARLTRCESRHHRDQSILGFLINFQRIRWTKLTRIDNKVMTMSEQLLLATTAADGLTICGRVFDRKLPSRRYQDVLGTPSRTIHAGPPPPAGHLNNQVHVFDSLGIYLTEHHASRLIESVNFVFDPASCPFPIKKAFHGVLRIDGQPIDLDTRERDLDSRSFVRDLAGEYSVTYKNCWIGVSTNRRCEDGKRRSPRHVARVSVCF